MDGTGRQAVEKAVLITQGSKILYAGPESMAPDVSPRETIDMAGRTLVPGLFNCHAHLSLRFPFNPYCVDEYGTPGYRTMVMFRRAVEALYCGVTTIRVTGEGRRIGQKQRRKRSPSQPQYAGIWPDLGGRFLCELVIPLLMGFCTDSFEGLTGVCQ